MGRKKREFSPAEVQDLVELFNEGIPTERIGELRGLSPAMVRRVLKAELGDLRTAKAMIKARRGRAGPSLRRRQAESSRRELGQLVTSKEYREGFEAGVRQAVTWAELHGLEAVRGHCNEVLLPWRDSGMGAPPPL